MSKLVTVTILLGMLSICFAQIMPGPPEEVNPTELPAGDVITKLKGRVVGWAPLLPIGNQLDITLDTELSGVITLSFWVADGDMGGFIGNLKRAKDNGTCVELRYHRDWTKVPCCVLDQVINVLC